MLGSRLSDVSSLHSYGEDYFDDIRPAEGDSKMDMEYSDKSNSGEAKAKIYWIYLKSGAGIILLPSLVLFTLLAQAIFTGSDYWLSEWTSYYENIHLQEKNGNHTFEKSWMISEEQNTNIIIYSVLVIVLFFFCIIRTVTFFTTCMRASVRLHNRLLSSVIRAPIAFFDKYPIGMVLNRVSRDLGIDHKNQSNADTLIHRRHNRRLITADGLRCDSAIAQLSGHLCSLYFDRPLDYDSHCGSVRGTDAHSTLHFGHN